MHEAPPPAVEARLTRAWEVLAGVRRSFHLMAHRVSGEPHAESRCFILPVGVRQRGTQAAFGLVLSQAQAREVAAAMLGIPEPELTDDDVVDACCEACNVLSGCVVSALVPESPLDLGLPRQLRASDYRELTLNSTLKAVFETGADGCDVHLHLFDPLSLPATQEH